MSNKVVYTCDVSDDGSDMDVSDNEEYTQQIPQTQPVPQQTNTIENKSTTSLPHQGMVTSLHRYMQQDTWRKDAIKPMAEKKLKHKPAPPNNSSYASIVSGRIRSFNPDESEEEECLSDDSFHTAPSSPQAIVIEDFEPGQIADPPTQDELLTKMNDLEKKIQAELTIQKQIKDRLEVIRTRKEELRIRRLQREVRRSIAQKRKSTATVKNASTDKISSATINVTQEAKEERSSDKESAPPLSKHAKKVLREEAAKKRKLKRLRSPLSEELNEISTDQDASNSLTEDQDEEEIGEEEDENEVKEDYDEENEDNEEDSPSEDKMEHINSDDLSYTQRKKIAKKQCKMANQENKFTDEEKELTKPDGPFYQPLPLTRNKQTIKQDRRAIQRYLKTLTLKHMELILMNLKQASITKQLTPRQELFVLILGGIMMHHIESYVMLEEPSYIEAINNKPEAYFIPPPLEPDFYGNWNTLDFDADYLTNYELYKCLRHFEAINSKGAMKKAIMFLLKSGEKPKSRWNFRTCNPYDDSPAGKAMRDDITLCTRVCAHFDEQRKRKCKEHFIQVAERKKQENTNANNNNKPKSKKAKAKALKIQARTKASKSRVNAQANSVKPTPMTTEESRNLDNENERLEKEIKYMAKHIETQMPHFKKQKITHTSNPPPNFNQHTRPIPPNQYNQQYKVETNHIPNNSTSKIEKSNTFKAPPPPNAHSVLNTKVDQSNRANNKTDFPPIEIIDTGKPQPAAAHQTITPVQHNTPKPTQNFPSTTSLNNSSNYVPYRSALSSLGLATTSSKLATQQPATNKSSALCNAESAGGVCNDKNCQFTHFRDFIK